ncbi:uncharacterized protein [Nothobranchius furzeri]|uniref:uncharacterized protein isoform X2 n=1 Tax=Nothobranchius furzeri TaxID=105023 RepID=UPI003904945D
MDKTGVLRSATSLSATKNADITCATCVYTGRHHGSHQSCARFINCPSAFCLFVFASRITAPCGRPLIKDEVKNGGSTAAYRSDMSLTTYLSGYVWTVFFFKQGGVDASFWRGGYSFSKNPGCVWTRPKILICAPEKLVPKVRDSLGQLASHTKPSVRNLGVTFDPALTLDSHASSLVGSSFFHLRNVAKLSPILSRSELETVLHTFISSRLDYCNSLFTCLSRTSLNRLQVVQNACAQLLTKSSKHTHITPIHEKNTKTELFSRKDFFFLPGVFSTNQS